MPHPNPPNFVQAVVMILDEYIRESIHSDGPGEPYESFDQIDGLALLTQDFGQYLANRDWNDHRDNAHLNDKKTTDIVLDMLADSGP